MSDLNEEMILEEDKAPAPEEETKEQAEENGEDTAAAQEDAGQTQEDTAETAGETAGEAGTDEEPEGGGTEDTDDVIAAVKEGEYKRVVLRPLMLVAGNHAVNDMASPNDPDSWYSRFSSQGYDTICIIEGLGQLEAVRDIYAEHAHRAIVSLAI